MNQLQRYVSIAWLVGVVLVGLVFTPWRIVTPDRNLDLFGNGTTGVIQRGSAYHTTAPIWDPPYSQFGYPEIAWGRLGLTIGVLTVVAGGIGLLMRDRQMIPRGEDA